MLFIGIWAVSCSQLPSKERVKIMKLQIVQKRMSEGGVVEFVLGQEEGPPSSVKTLMKETVPFYQITYAVGVDQLNEQSRNFLSANLNIIKQQKLHLIAFTDQIGSYRINQKVSSSRIKNIKRFLVQNGVAENKISVEIRPKCCYLSGSQDPSLMQINRRVEFHLLDSREDS